MAIVKACNRKLLMQSSLNKVQAEIRARETLNTKKDSFPHPLQPLVMVVAIFA
jgi:hypothetical protein